MKPEIPEYADEILNGSVTGRRILRCQKNYHRLLRNKHDLTLEDVNLLEKLDGFTELLMTFQYGFMMGVQYAKKNGTMESGKAAEKK